MRVIIPLDPYLHTLAIVLCPLRGLPQGVTMTHQNDNERRNQCVECENRHDNRDMICNDCAVKHGYRDRLVDDVDPHDPSRQVT